MALLLMHETAHAFGLDERYNIDSHSENGMQCVMETFKVGDRAQELYEEITQNGRNAFCDTCESDLIDALSEQ